MISFLLSAIRLATPLCLAAMGGYFSERAGIVNIALEGIMLIGSFTGAAVAYSTHNPWLGLSAAIAASIVFSLLHGLLCLKFKADHVISGLTVNFLALGLPPVICKAFYEMSGGTPSLEITDRIPALFGISPLILIAFVAVAKMNVLHKYTIFGQYLRFAGEHPKALQSQGISVEHVRWLAMICTGICCGLAGAYLSIDHGGGFTRNMTAGRGYIALAALIIGRWSPLRAGIAALVFGAIEATQILLQGSTFPGGQSVPVQWIQILPFALTLFLLAGFGLKKLGQSRPPKVLGDVVE